MVQRLSALINRILYRASAVHLSFSIRKYYKKIYDLRKKDIAPLTKEERRSVKRADYPDYTLYKYMGGAENLRYYIPVAPFITVLMPALNPLNHSPSGASQESSFSDKNYAEVFMSGLQFPEVAFRRIKGQFYTADLRRITKEEALALAAPYTELVFKQAIGSSHGKGVKLIQAEDFEQTILSYGNDYLAQKRIVQHENLSYFNESSVNIIRITSLCWNGNIYILSGILRIGAPGSFCDHLPHGGVHNLDVALNEDGTFHSTAFDPDHCYIYDTVYGKEICGCIPRYEDLKELVIREHAKYPYFGLIGWDFTIDHEGNIVCMEFNSRYPGIIASQYALGPIFAQKSKDGVPLLDEILAQHAPNKKIGYL